MIFELNIDKKESLKEMNTFFARLMNQYEFRYQIVFSARFDKQDEAKQVLDEIEFFIKLNMNQKLTESDIGNIDNEFSL